MSTIAFHKQYSGVFATTCLDEIRLWSPTNSKQLLRIEMVHEEESDFTSCNCVSFMPDGKSLISGWTDGKIRAYLPQSGKMYWIINQGHTPAKEGLGGVTCLCPVED